ncbi:MAG: A/G-specific adenine glycosylase [Magnetococcus sp. DMHC-6]
MKNFSTATQRLLDHYDRHGRRLPWRETQDPYAIWVAETLLQQTGVNTVIPYYVRFMTRFPTVDLLSYAQQEEVLNLWQGLGYYQRARHLHQAARLVSEELSGQLPREKEKLLKLPGIGPNTAAAILAIAFGQPETIFDGNVQRVFARLLALPDPLPSTQGKAQLWEAAQRQTSHTRPGDYAQAIMDLGATICTPRNPDCPRCPWQEDCLAQHQGHPERYPLTLPKKTKPRLTQISLLIHNPNHQLLLCRRPEKGLLGGLWEPPSTPPQPQTPDSPLHQAHLFAQTFGLTTTLTPHPPVKHTFTHFHLTAYPFTVDQMQNNFIPVGNHTYLWLSHQEIHLKAISTLHKKILKHLD